MADKRESAIVASTPTSSSDFARFVTSANGNSGKVSFSNLETFLTESCGLYFKNSIFRGASLGSEFKSAHQTAISNGSFTGLFLGDYWTINSVNWRIWGFNYYKGRGDTNCTTNHVVVMPDSNLLVADGSTTHYMNDTDTTAGGYQGSKCRTTYLTNTSESTYPYQKIANAFGASHILAHRELISTAVSNGAASSWAWYDSKVEIPSETMLYGHTVWSNGGYNTASMPGQLPLAAIKPEFVFNRNNYWLRDVASASTFAVVSTDGAANGSGASNAWFGVRPYFLLS